MSEPAPELPELYVASACYGGQAHARHFRSILALRKVAAARGVALRLDLGGGEALLDRGRAGALASFLATPATHLLLTDGQTAFDPEALVDTVQSGEILQRFGPASLLLARDVASRIAEADPKLKASLGDLRGGGRPIAAVFGARIEPGSRHYVTDLDALLSRWSEIAG